jgi:DNA invertase Pin-like site-specific DNA recombinase
MKGGENVIAMYLRLSADDGFGESESISGQRDLIADFLAGQSEFSGSKIIEFADDGWSGTDFNRPAVKELLELVRCGKVHCIVVKDFSRFGRNYIEVGDYLEQIFPFLGVRFISVNNNFDSKKEPYSAGSLDVTFKNLVNEMYSKDISKKVKDAKYAKMKNGELMAGCPPYGYTISKERKNRIIVDPVAAANIRRIFDLYVSGVDTAAIASLFNAEKIPTRAEYLKSIGYKCSSKEGTFWTQETIAIMLREETYIGTFKARQTKVVRVGSSKVVPTPKEEWIVIPNNHEAIIPNETFDSAQERLGEKKNTPRNKRGHVFSGKVVCGHCRRFLRRRELKKQGAYFICNSYKFADCGCSRGRLAESELNETLLCAIRKQAEMALIADSMLSELKSLAIGTGQKILKNISAMQSSVDNLKQSKIQLYERYKADELTKELYLAERAQIEQELFNLVTRLDESKLNLEQLHAGDTENQFIRRFKDFVDLTNLTQDVVQTLVSAVYVYDPDSIEIEWNYADDFKRMVELVESQTRL